MSSKDQEIKANLNKLARGLLQNDLNGAYQSYREIYNEGPVAVPYVSKVILEHDWRHIKEKGKVRYLGGLYSLLRDIDEDYAKEISTQIINSGCDNAIKSLLNSLNRFSSEDYVNYEVAGIKVFEHRGLGSPLRIRPRLEQWIMEVPEADVRGIDRIYVVREEEQNYSGLFRPVLNVITIVWYDRYSKFNPLSWLMLRFIKHTFFHELGHYHNEHTFGNDVEQEREADEYASMRMSISHPISSLLIRALIKLKIIKKESE